MTHRAFRDDLDHGWTRSPLTDPYPWGASLPDEWMSVELNFYRMTSSTANDIGGFKGSGVASNYLIINGHAELLTDAGMPDIGQVQAVGAFIARHYEIIMPIPSNLSTVPLKGDRVWWYDAIGRRIDVALRSVDVPEGLADHIEISSDEFE